MRKKIKKNATSKERGDPRQFLCPCSATYWQYLAEEGQKCLRDN